MCNNTQKKKAAGAGKDFTLFFGVMLHFNFKCVRVSVSPKPFSFLLFLVFFPTYREYTYCQKLHAIMEHVGLQ